MKTTIRAWKDPAFRTTLDDAERDLMSDSPVGSVGGSEADLGLVIGGDHRPWTFHTCFSCFWGTAGCFTPGTCVFQTMTCC